MPVPTPPVVAPALKTSIARLAIEASSVAWTTTSSPDNRRLAVTPPRVKLPRAELAPMTRSRALTGIAPEVLTSLCKLFSQSSAASSEMRELMRSRLLADRQDGFVLFCVQQSNVLIGRFNDAIEAAVVVAPKHKVKHPGSAARRLGPKAKPADRAPQPVKASKAGNPKKAAKARSTKR